MIAMANHDLSKQEALDKAQVYCARAEHCAADVRRKFYEWQINPDFFDFIEEKLYADGYLNDERFCRAYVHDKVEYQSWGRMKIQAGLRALQLPERAIRQALNEIDLPTYNRRLQALIRQRSSDPEEKRLRFLLQRGFTYDEIKSVDNK